MWRSVHLPAPTGVDSKGIFEQVKDVEHDSLPWLAGWWRVPHQRDGAGEMRGRTASPAPSLQEAWMHYPTVRLQEKPRLLPTCCIWGVERDADQSPSVKMTGRHVKKRKSLMAEKRMWRDTACRPHFGSIESEACSTDGRNSSFAHFSFLKDHWSRERKPLSA